MVNEFITTYAISAYHHWSLKFESPSGEMYSTQQVTSLCDIVCQWLPTGRWFSPSTLDSSTNKTDRLDITEILLKVALNTINLKPINQQIINCMHLCILHLKLYEFNSTVCWNSFHCFCFCFLRGNQGIDFWCLTLLSTIFQLSWRPVF